MWLVCLAFFAGSERALPALFCKYQQTQRSERRRRAAWVPVSSDRALGRLPAWSLASSAGGATGLAAAVVMLILGVKATDRLRRHAADSVFPPGFGPVHAGAGQALGLKW
jgi:hypothetical protein